MNDNTKYLKDHNITAINVEQLHSRFESSISMHIEVPYDAKDQVINCDFWSKGIQVSGWRFRFNNRSVSTRFDNNLNRRSNDRFNNRNWEFDY